MVDISLAGSQTGFVCAYVYFIGTNGKAIIYEATNGEVDINKWWFGLLCFVIYTPMVFVRKIETFAATHLFGDVMIIITVVAIVIYAGFFVSDNGF